MPVNRRDFLKTTLAAAVAPSRRRGRELYHGLTEWVDDEIGRVLTALERSPFAPDTVVVYTADHGENMGEHGLWWKNCVYEQAARVPLIVSWPTWDRSPALHHGRTPNLPTRSFNEFLAQEIEEGRHQVRALRDLTIRGESVHDSWKKLGQLRSG